MNSFRTIASKFKSVRLIFLLPIFYLASCDPRIGYEYYVTNKSDKQLKVYIKGYYRDTTQMKLIFPNSESLIYQIDLWGSNPHDEKEDFLNNIDSLKIISSDSSKILLDYLKRDNWTYTRDIGHFGIIRVGTNIYKLEINNDDFEK